MAKGKTIRPCYFCYEPVNFVLWDEETKKRNKRIFHWANPDGSHHYHKKIEVQIDHEYMQHIRDIT